MISKIYLKLKKLYIKEIFNPSILGLFINPFFISRRGLAKEIRKKSKYINGKVIDVGCGSKPYKNFFEYNEYIGIDLKKNNKSHLDEVDQIFDGINIPFEKNTFDSFICSQVFEHVFDLNNLLKSIHAVLKNKGKGLITIPFIWDEHEQPYDYARYTTFGIEDILKKSGFKILSINKINNNFSIIFQLISLYIYKIIPNSKFIHLFFTFFVFSLLNLTGILIKNIFPKNNDMFLDLIIIVEKT